MDLFDHQIIPLPLTDKRQAQISFWPNWLDGGRADALLGQSINHIDWRSDQIRIAGKIIPIPRLQQWFGDPGTSYTYSNIRLPAVAFPDWIEKLREAIEDQSGERFNRALVNYYRDGSDSVDWHADDEAELGFEPLVASLSLGAERVFQLRHNITQERLDISLPHGSLLVMGAGIQSYWQHRIGKSKKIQQPRVNFTFRYMAP
ncbi:MAG: alpha-ketoglutarate-dependent dioxygenase AlkB [Porticoccaceae bacterium]|jgi:alkylated DNA repair dioxygenase AlkB|nr:alpha-ketoglutarate-dependent dioxygenase AlkB [Porticoccaceae bacterium]